MFEYFKNKTYNDIFFLQEIHSKKRQIKLAIRSVVNIFVKCQCDTSFSCFSHELRLNIIVRMMYLLALLQGVSNYI